MDSPGFCIYKRLNIILSNVLTLLLYLEKLHHADSLIYLYKTVLVPGRSLDFLQAYHYCESHKGLLVNVASDEELIRIKQGVSLTQSIWLNLVARQGPMHWTAGKWCSTLTFLRPSCSIWWQDKATCTGLQVGGDFSSLT